MSILFVSGFRLEDIYNKLNWFYDFYEILLINLTLIIFT